jgi:hypothetical protein
MKEEDETERRRTDGRKEGRKEGEVSDRWHGTRIKKLLRA